MDRFLATSAVLILCTYPALASADDDSRQQKPKNSGTFSAVRALANSAGPAMSEPDRKDDGNTFDTVRHLARRAEPEEQEQADAPQPPEAKPKARRAAREVAPANNARKPAAEQAKKQIQRRPQNDQAWQQGGLGLQPMVGDQFMNGWGNGIYSNQIIGYRSYRYSGYGNRYGYANPYLYPAYGYGYGYGYGFGYGFSPVMPTISGPVTTRYADPVGRQYKMMDDSIRKFAEGR
mgnify:CR=1 FL=1